jgi:hypothetical protein
MALRADDERSLDASKNHRFDWLFPACASFGGAVDILWGTHHEESELRTSLTLAGAMALSELAPARRLSHRNDHWQ